MGEEDSYERNEACHGPDRARSCADCLRDLCWWRRDQRVLKRTMNVKYGKCLEDEDAAVTMVRLSCARRSALLCVKQE